jgi:hypothetical protein
MAHSRLLQANPVVEKQQKALEFNSPQFKTGCG